MNQDCYRCVLRRSLVIPQIQHSGMRLRILRYNLYSQRTLSLS
jgi:hypothetical protein